MATFKSTENQRDRRENQTGPFIDQLLHFTIRETDGQRKKVTCPDLHRKLPTELLPGPESAFNYVFNEYLLVNRWEGPYPTLVERQSNNKLETVSHSPLSPYFSLDALLSYRHSPKLSLF